MSRRRRTRILPIALDRLEVRWLLAGGQLPGNAGAIIGSQYQAFGFSTKVGTQFQNVTSAGPINIDLVTPPSSSDAQGVGPFPANTGLIGYSQFNSGGFRTVGLQLDTVALGGGLTVAGSDNEDIGDNPSAVPPTVTNANLISNSQFNDGGFGTLTLAPNGQLVPIHSRAGLQWRNVGVGGPVGVGLDDVVIRPTKATAAAATPAAVPAATDASSVTGAPGQKVIDFTTNTGQITNSQFNDGGFGDIGFQWSNVGVGNTVGTSSNTLFINPLQNGTGPITVENQTFGANLAVATPSASPAVASPAATTTATAAATPLPPDFETTYDNSATNSGQIVNSQVNDGGFGDIGLQWQDVHVKGSVSAVHNALTVQPQNIGQKQITVQNVSFPSVASTPTPTPAPLAPVADDPPVVANDGVLTNPLPTPTGPLSPFFSIPFGSPGTLTFGFPGNFPLENAASNSGLIQNAQFSAGGFGDEGLQWQKVEVGGNVNVVHNSLSVHPEGSQMSGITVSNVAYGDPVTPALNRKLKDLRFLALSPAYNTTPYGRFRPAGTTLLPPNDRILTNQQVAQTGGTDVVLQWNGIEHNRGLVLVDNVIKIQGVGPLTGPIILSNIRFPGTLPLLRPHVTVVPASDVATAATPAAATSSGATSDATSVGIEPRNAVLLNDSNNSGIVSGAQFSAGGFGDDGLQWNNVAVTGSVNVVHNQLSVDESSDLPAGDKPGPILISNVSFNSGALEGGVSTKQDQVVVAPPRFFQAASTHKVDVGAALPQNPLVRQDTSNSGILRGGQMAAGAANHALLQWQCVRVGGSVTVIDNVLTISVQNNPTGPIVLSNVTFA